jgi:hypothetical protein
MARNPTDEAIAKLETDWPDWQIWVVWRAYGGPLWCARRRDDEKRVLHADSPHQLARHLGSGPSRRT